MAFIRTLIEKSFGTEQSERNCQVLLLGAAVRTKEAKARGLIVWLAG